MPSFLNCVLEVIFNNIRKDNKIIGIFWKLQVQFSLFANYIMFHLKAQQKQLQNKSKEAK